MIIRMCLGADVKPCNPTAERSSRGKSPTQDESRAVSLDIITKLMDRMDQSLKELTKRMDLIDKRYKNQDLRQQKRLEIFGNKLCEDLHNRFEKFRQEIKSAG